MLSFNGIRIHCSMGKKKKTTKEAKLKSNCLPENPWRKFPFTTFVAMISTILTLSIDSYAMSCFKKKKLENGDGNVGDYVQNNAKMEFQNGHVHGVLVLKCDDKGSQLLRYRVVAQADYGMRMKSMLVLFFSITTPFGIALGIGLSNVYSENSPTSLIVVGLLNACSAGLLNYMALVDLLAFDFMGTKLQNNIKLQSWAYLAVLLGAGGMSIMAIWA
uniref:ZIP transporter n=1 Tax=Solanum tuberosum TaxID=4113 RepID=M1DC20_SOLTU